jgi:fatty acid desaturase
VTQTPDLLVSDADRARVSSQLREHYESGRLTLDEFQERLDETHQARTEAQLENVLRQLPSPKLPSVRRRDRRWRSLAFQYAIVNLIAVLIWAFSGNGIHDFWPKWVFLVTLIMFVRRAFGHRQRALPRPPRPPHL